jgi:RNA polymerase sigma factor (sigma-70 family)
MERQERDMYEQGWLTRRFDEHRPRLLRVAYRMLGSLSEAEDAVQEAWRRLHRIDPDTVEDLGGWLTTVVSRVCLRTLRSRTFRHDDRTGDQVTALSVVEEEGAGPGVEAMLVDSVDAVLLRALDALTPSERLAYVLHHLFAIPFDEIGAIVDEPPAVARELAGRARRRVRGEMAS